MSLTAYERETVIVFNDEDENAVITTHQRKMLTKLDRHPEAEQIEDLTHEGQRGARYTIPARYVRFGKRQTRPGAASNLRSNGAQS